MAGSQKWLILLLVVATAVASGASRIPMETRGNDPFARLDKDKDGFITSSEAKAAGFDWSGKTGLSYYDLNNDQKLSKDEFGIVLKVAADLEETNYLGHFKKADSNHDGYVTAQELQYYFETDFNKDFSLQGLTRYISPTDKDGDGQLNYNEFKKAMGFGV
ncbi:uncharacterized protein LOC144657702 [Oculina patagonica]